MFNLRKLSDEDIIDLLFKIALPKTTESKILKEIKRRFALNSVNYSLKLEKKHSLEKMAKEKSSLIINSLSNKNISFNRKKTIVDLLLTDEEKINLLNYRLVSKSIKDYIKNQHYENYTIYFLLFDNNLSQKVFDFLLTKINYKNIFYILGYKYLDIKKTKIILQTKAKDIKKAINIASPSYLLYLYLNNELPSQILNYIKNHKQKYLDFAFKLLTKEEIKKYLLTPVSSVCISLLYQKRQKTLTTILLNLTEEEITIVLNNRIVINDIKQIIIKNNSINYQKVIQNINFQNADEFMDNCCYLPKELIDQIFIKKRSIILKIFNKDDFKIYLYKFETMPYLIKKMYDLYQEQFNEKDLNELFILSDMYSEKLLEFLILKNPDYIENLFNQVLFNKTVKIKKEIIQKIICIKSDLMSYKIKKISKTEQFNLLKTTHYLELQKIILNEFGLIKDQEFLLSLINSNITEEILFHYDIIKEFILKTKINYNRFLQYGMGSEKYNNWSKVIIWIINNHKQEEFIKIKNYFMNNYYQNSDKYLEINNFLDILDNYYKYQDICLYLVNNNISLNNGLKSSIQFLFTSNQSEIIPKNLEELISFKKNIYNEYSLKIKENNIDISELKVIIEHLFSKLINSSLINIGGEFSIESIPNLTREIRSLKDELMIYARLNNILNYINDEDSLKKIIKLIIENEDISYLMEKIEKINSKIKKLYELDSKENLTTLIKAREITDIQDQTLKSLYGGEVFDFHDKDYVLYAHVVSKGESIEDLVNGISTAKTNFISLSPISYMGQKYYYDSDSLILAYDTIPDNSFICSSTSNMGSNYLISQNSFEVKDISRVQKGIVDTSAVIFNNSEALFYREGLKPCGIILKGGRTPTKREIEYHQIYNLPFIITQSENRIENPQRIFKRQEVLEKEMENNHEIERFIDLIAKIAYKDKIDEIYTGRRIGIFTDSHALYEPTKAILQDMQREGITEIYSLGDNIGFGPNPKEVLELIEKYQVKSVMGNHEYYLTLGVRPFNYLTPNRIKSSEWTEKQVGSYIKNLMLYNRSIELIIGHKKVALCHFANDVRFDIMNSTWTYQNNYPSNEAAKQFLYTNSLDYFNYIKCNIAMDSSTSSVYQDVKSNLLFQGKPVTYYDSIFQGHVHFEMKDHLKDTSIYTLRGVGLGYSRDPIDSAYYIILKEKKTGGFDIEKRLVTYDRDSLIRRVNDSDMPCKETIKKYLNIR